MVTVVQSARCDECTSGLVTQAVLRWAARELLPTGTDNILAWLRRRGPSRTPSPGYLLADVRADLLRVADEIERAGGDRG
jgi:hypothetical protein